MSMIQATNLTRRFGPTRAVSELSFELGENTLAALLGPNGAGKSTTIRILTATLPPSSGSASIAGYDVQNASLKARLNIGYLPESTPLYPEMTVKEYLHFRGRLMNMSRPARHARIAKLLDDCGLATYQCRTIGRLSKGNRQRVGIAQALLHEPPILILDEPTSSLDPSQVAALRSMLQTLKQQHTILISSHILPEVEQVADTFLVMNRGRLVAQGSASSLKQQGQSLPHVRVEAKCDGSTLRRICESFQSVTLESLETQEGWTRAVLKGDDPHLAMHISEALREQAIVLRELSPLEPSLEELFVRLTSGLVKPSETDHAVANEEAVT